jgi:hypothetical protein
MYLCGRIVPGKKDIRETGKKLKKKIEECVSPALVFSTISPVSMAFKHLITMSLTIGSRPLLNL